VPANSGSKSSGPTLRGAAEVDDKSPCPLQAHPSLTMERSGFLSVGTFGGFVVARRKACAFIVGTRRWIYCVARTRSSGTRHGLSGEIREKRISLVNALADSQSTMFVEWSTARWPPSSASCLLIIVPNANACWKAARSAVGMSIGYLLAVEFDSGRCSDRKNSVNTHVDLECGSQFVVAFAPHQNRLARAFEWLDASC
jgi:hypothetical protein